MGFLCQRFPNSRKTGLFCNFWCQKELRIDVFILFQYWKWQSYQALEEDYEPYESNSNKKEPSDEPNDPPNPVNADQVGEPKLCRFRHFLHWRKKFCRKENMADLADVAKICQIKFPPKSMFSSICQIKYPPNLIYFTLFPEFVVFSLDFCAYLITILTRNILLPPN